MVTAGAVLLWPEPGERWRVVEVRRESRQAVVIVERDDEQQVWWLADVEWWIGCDKIEVSDEEL